MLSNRSFGIFVGILFLMSVSILANEKPVTVRLEGGDWGYPNPFSHYSRGPGVFKMTLIFESLLERGEKGLIPWVAKSWTVDQSGKKYTFSIHRNITFHDGKPCTAHDIKFSFEYFSKYPPVSNTLDFEGMPFISSVEAPDSFTVVISTIEPLAISLEKIGATRILPKHIWEGVDDPQKYSAPESVIGSGPFVLKQYIKETGAYAYEAYKKYWGPKPSIDILQFVPVSDPVLAFEKGDIDLTTITPDFMARFSKNPKYKILQNPGFWGYRILLNLEKKPELQKKEIRQAIIQSVNRQEIVEKVGRNAAATGSAGYLPEDHILYNKNICHYEYNPDKALKILGDLNLSLTFLCANSPEENRITELLKVHFAKAGITVNIKCVDMKSRDASVRKGEYEAALIGHGGWGNDPDLLRLIYANTFTASKSPSVDKVPGYSNDSINELCLKQIHETDPDKRKTMIFKLQELIAQEVPQIPLFNKKAFVVYRPDRYNGWRYMYDHHEVTHNKLSFLQYNE